jgi:hypothetical protein
MDKVASISGLDYVLSAWGNRQLHGTETTALVEQTDSGPRLVIRKRLPEGIIAILKSGRIPSVSEMAPLFMQDQRIFDTNTPEALATFKVMNSTFAEFDLDDIETLVSEWRELRFFEAAVSDSLLLSYQLLASQKPDLLPALHGLLYGPVGRNGIEVLVGQSYYWIERYNKNFEPEKGRTHHLKAPDFVSQTVNSSTGVYEGETQCTAFTDKFIFPCFSAIDEAARFCGKIQGSHPSNYRKHIAFELGLPRQMLFCVETMLLDTIGRQIDLNELHLYRPAEPDRLE